MKRLLIGAVAVTTALAARQWLRKRHADRQWARAVAELHRARDARRKAEAEADMLQRWYEAGTYQPGDGR